MPSSQPSTADSEAELRSLDARLEQAGTSRADRRRRVGATSRPPRLEGTNRDDFSGRRLLRVEPIAAANGVHWLAAAGWERFGWLWHGFSTRKGGVSLAYSGESAQGELNLGFTATDSAESVNVNRGLLAQAVTGDPLTPLVTIRQIHSNIVVRAGRDAARSKPLKADGAMTDEPGILLGVQTADCIPVLVVDRKRRAVAAFHAGWRGTVQRIVEAGIGRMQLEFGSHPEDLVAAIGPGIGQCCYFVGEEVLAEFESQFAYALELFVRADETDPVRARYPAMFLNQRAPGHGAADLKLHLDLTEANRRQLLAAGLKPRSIQSIGGCTSCLPALFFSHRASRGHAGRMMSVIGVRPR
jgi:YfiH family protein